jgi:hypothetical protein
MASTIQILFRTRRAVFISYAALLIIVLASRTPSDNFLVKRMIVNRAQTMKDILQQHDDAMALFEEGDAMKEGGDIRNAPH